MRERLTAAHVDLCRAGGEMIHELVRGRLRVATLKDVEAKLEQALKDVRSVIAQAEGRK